MHVALPVNRWPSSKCAKAFWSQQDVGPYQQLLSDTIDWANPEAGEHWLDLGCGGGPISRALWERTNGTVGSVIGLDCAAVNDTAYERLRAELQVNEPDRLHFVHHDFSSGLGIFPDARFDHVVSGLSISYAESYDEGTGRWTTAAYDRLPAEVRRVLRPGGRFVFSVNVPEPSWSRIAMRSMPGLLRSGRPLRSMKRALRMLRYGRWLKKEARIGRFHYLPAGEVTQRLVSAGFTNVSHRLSYCEQAYIFRAVNPA